MEETLLDTDILSYFLKGSEKVTDRVKEYLKHFSTLTFSSITYYEVLAGLEYKNAKTQKDRFKDFSENCNIINIESESIFKSARIYGELRRKGITIGTSDLLIAGIAIKHDLVLATNNLGHFSQIEELKIHDWKE